MKYLFFAFAILVSVAKTILHYTPYSSPAMLSDFWLTFFILCALIAYKADQIRDAIKNK